MDNWLSIHKLIVITFLILLLLFSFQGCELPTEVEDSFPPTVPAPLSPTNESSFQNLTPTLVVRNSSDYRGAQVSYTFEVYSDQGLINSITRGENIQAGAERTNWRVSPALEAGTTYYWRARGYNGTTYSPYSALYSFTPYSPCNSLGTPSSPWAKAVVDSYIGCGELDNLYTDPTQALGPPDAWRVDQSVRILSGVVSLGLNGYIVVDMGVCIVNRDGPDLRIYQFVSHEPIHVFVSPTPDGPWADLGEKLCWHPYCEYDLEGCIYEAIRYVKILDKDPVGECIGTSRYTPGADIDAVRALNYR